MIEANKPLVSIVTPSYNQGRFIESTILSVLSQDYPYIEYSIIDGGSTDDTVELIKKYTNKLFYWVSEKDNGQSAAINKGFHKATGKYVNWLNSDDILLDNSISKLVDYLEKKPNIDVVYGNAILIDEQGNEIQRRNDIEYDNNILLYGTNYLPQPSALIRMDSLRKTGFLDENIHFCMDHELWLRFNKAGFCFGYLNDYISGYRIHKQAKGYSGNKEKMKNERLYLKRKYGLKIKNIYLEKIVYLNLFIYYRIRRKILQYIQHKRITLPIIFRF